MPFVDGFRLQNGRMAATSPTPTVSRVDGRTIVEIVYDPLKRATALIEARDGAWRRCDELRMASGEVLVPYGAENNLIRHGCVMLPTEPTAFGDKAQLLHEIEGYLHRYVDLSASFERIAAHYILLTWVFDAFSELPYLRLRGDYGSGKTRALLALGSIAYKGFFASGASTVSPIFHTLENFGGTLILDEADMRFSDKTSDLVKILNNGTVKGLPVLRTLQNRHKEFNPAAFTVYGPKIVAMRNSFQDEALESRFLTEDMGKRPLRADIPIQLPDTLKAEAQDLRNKLLYFRISNLAKMHGNPAKAIAGVAPRFNQTALSLLSIADDQRLLADIANLVRAQEQALAVRRFRNPEARILKAAEESFRTPNARSVPLRNIAERASEASGTEDHVSPRQAGQVLRSKGFRLYKSNGAILVRRSAAHSPLVATTDNGDDGRIK